MSPPKDQPNMKRWFYLLFATIASSAASAAAIDSGFSSINLESINRLSHEPPTPIKSSQTSKEPSSRITIGLVLSPLEENEDSSRGLTTSTRSHYLETLIQNHLNDINANASVNDRYQVVNLVTSEMVENPIEMSKIVCQQMMANPLGGVSAIIVDTDPLYMDSIASISFTLGLYNIPVIGTTLRDSSLFNKNLHASYISLIPPNSHQADVWCHLLAEFGFKRTFVLISMENHDLLSRFVDLVDGQQTNDDDRRLEIEAIIEYDFVDFEDDTKSSWLYLVERLSSLLENSICRVFLIHAQSKNDVRLFMKLLDHFNLTSNQGAALIFSERTVQLATDMGIPVPIGAIWSRLGGLSDPVQVRKSFALDALDLVVRSANETMEYLASEQSKLPNSCQTRPSDMDWHAGIELYRAISRQQFSGLTGYISFDENGDRLTANYELFNSVELDTSTTDDDMLGVERVSRSIGEFWNGRDINAMDGGDVLKNANLGSKISVNISSITWPGGISGELISGVHINRHLSIVTIEEKPFVWVLDEQECGSISRAGGDWQDNTVARIPCRRMSANIPDGGERLCCKGYCMDLLKEISHRLNFTYDLYLAPDNQYGNLGPELRSDHVSDEDKPPSVEMGDSSRGRREQYREGVNNNSGGFTGTQRLKWGGLMGELVARRADMAFAPLTITQKRAQAIDFSKPFKFHGFSILLRRAPKHTTLASFLQPFHNLLWILVIGVATHVVALTLYLLDRYSTLGHFGIKRGFIPKPATDDSDDGNGNGDRPLHLSGSLWFSWSILLNSGVGEHTPKSLSGRVLGIFWSGFAMIVVASYTANLAAFLVLDSRDETPNLSGIDDPRLRSGDLAFNFATIKNSAVDAYLQSQVEYINLYRKMEEFDFGTVDESIRALRASVIDALIWDSTRLEWEVATDENCSLGIAGELFGSGGYAIGLQRNSHWTKNVTTKLLELHESGYMIELDKKWIAAGRGSREESPEVQGANNQHTMAVDADCERRPEDKPETLGIFNIAGVFILFACGLVISVGLIVLERLCYKHRWRRIRSSNLSNLQLANQNQMRLEQRSH